MPIDFSRLGSRTPEEQEADRLASNERAWKADETQRDALCAKGVTIRLVQEPEPRMLPTGERVLLLRGTEEGRAQPLLAVYRTPLRVVEDAEIEDRFERKIAALGGGDVVSLAGKWNKRRWRDGAGEQKESWEFAAQHFAEGAMPMDRVIERSRHEFGEGARAPAMAAPALALAAATGRDR